jgi:large subunit ribosomal protein L46
MNTWVVGHVPVGYYIQEPRAHPETSVKRPAEKTFFMKARIMAGQANIKDNVFGLTDFKWLTKLELQEHVGARYFSFIKNMLADR